MNVDNNPTIIRSSHVTPYEKGHNYASKEMMEG
jgi:hypothetical protein